MEYFESCIQYSNCEILGVVFMRIMLRIGLGLMIGARDMFVRGIDREEFERFGSGIHEIVLGAGGDEEEVVRGNRFFRAVQNSLSCPRNKYECLIDVMCFDPDILARINTHEEYLTVFASDNFFAEPSILFRQLCDVIVYAVHRIWW